MPRRTAIPANDILSITLFLAPLAYYSYRKTQPEPSDDLANLRKAHELRRRLRPPPQSRFRVVALLLLDDGSTIFGSNDEPGPWIGGAICAERAAFLQLRLTAKDHSVVAVYIVTDAEEPVSPGMMCREFMLGSPSVSGRSTRIVLQSANEKSDPQVHTLDQLYPYPSIFLRKSVEEQETLSHDMAPIISVKIEDLAIPELTREEIQELYSTAKAAASLDCCRILHPVGFGAAAAIRRKDKVVVVGASQLKAIEYGSTLDAVTQLAPQILANKTDEEVLAVVQVDHRGCVHAPFASARALLVEHGLGSTWCLCTNHSGSEVIAVRAKVLAPLVPVFR